MSHATIRALIAYAGGDPALDDAAVWAVESHLDACAQCRGRLAELTPPPARDLLDDVRATILHEARIGPQPSPPAFRWRPAYLWAAWSALGWAVLAATAVLVALLLDLSYPENPSLVLLLAPVAPIAGLVVAWSRQTDPGWELLAGTARAGPELMLRRTLLVLAATLPPLGAAGALLGTSPWLWLLPCLTFTSATLWLGSRIGVSRAAALLAGGWAGVVVAPAVMTLRVPLAIAPEGVPGWAVAAVICTVLAALRTDGFLRLRSWQ
ncbi:anti-sigma factor [Catenuloplanes japonicus]|uniref:hypothetical protein n=1 Tax=Catenuloplanes japonicus TaxID=33876 RepID=UPI0005264F13|nr:hypothetical protein [Catenuloplanes japonicus]